MSASSGVLKGDNSSTSATRRPHLHLSADQTAKQQDGGNCSGRTRRAEDCSSSSSLRVAEPVTVTENGDVLTRTPSSSSARLSRARFPIVSGRHQKYSQQTPEVNNDDNDLSESLRNSFRENELRPRTSSFSSNSTFISNYAEDANDKMPVLLDTPKMGSRQNSRVSQLSRQGTQTSTRSSKKSFRSEKSGPVRRQETFVLPKIVTAEVPKTLSLEEQKMLQKEVKAFRDKSNIRPGFDGRSLFRRTIRIILHLQQWISAIMEKGEEESQGAEKTSSFSDFAQALSSQRMANSDVHFDPADFKAKKDINISKDVQYILNLPKAMRTPDQVQSVLYGLQHLRSFAEYPLHMQEKLCKVAFFQTVTPKRVIIRQGHYAENFYFILSGHAMVTLLERDAITGETQLRAVKTLKKGQSFGELALLHHQLRNATVVSQDTVQLLTIGRDDFFDIFMGQSANPGELPEHLKFLSQLEFAKDFPMEKILENPEVCLLHFFKRGEVIVQDSSQSDWIYIIKSGTCQVMKELNGAQGLKLHKRSKTVDDLTMRLPKLGTAEQAPKIYTGKKRHRSYTMPTALRRAMTEYEDSLRLTGGRLPVLEEKALVSVDPSSRDGVERPVPGRTPGYSRSKLSRFPEMKKTAHFSPSPSPELKTPKRSTPQPQEPLQVNQWSTLLNILKVETPREDVFKQRRKSEPPKAQPVYVQVDLLKPRDIFGLNTVKFDLEMEIPNTKVSLVSRGAECVMLAKSFFARNANEKVKHVVRNLARPYPSEDALQKNLQMKEDWANFKKDLIQDIVSRPTLKKLQ